jgi:RNA polymerase sigma-70 factor (ECF subfamily)
MQLATGINAIHPTPNTAPFPQAFAASGPQLLERLFEAHHRLVYSAAWRVTGNAADAEDVMQTVFLRLAGRDLSADLIENPEGYLRRAAVNASINLLELKSRKNVSLEKSAEPTDHTSHAERSDLREVLRMAMAKLGARTAEMFALRFLEGHSNPEIAEMFGISTLVVSVTLHRARKQLQKEIRQLGGLQ